MNTKHTPGPWKIQPFNSQQTKKADAIISCNGFIIHPELGVCGGNVDQADANARLISAGPDLLHAAEVAFEILAALADPEHVMHEAMKTARPELLIEWRDTIAAAIAKAKGAQ